MLLQASGKGYGFASTLWLCKEGGHQQESTNSSSVCLFSVPWGVEQCNNATIWICEEPLGFYAR